MKIKLIDAINLRDTGSEEIEGSKYIQKLHLYACTSL